MVGMGKLDTMHCDLWRGTRFRHRKCLPDTVTGPVAGNVTASETENPIVYETDCVGAWNQTEVCHSYSCAHPFGITSSGDQLSMVIIKQISLHTVSVIKCIHYY